MLRWRLFLGTIFIAALIGLCWVDYLASPPGIVLLPLALALCLLASQEYLGLLAARGGPPTQQPNADRQPIASIVYLGSLLVVLVNVIPVIAQTARGESPRLEPLGWPLVA